MFDPTERAVAAGQTRPRLNYAGLTPAKHTNTCVSMMDEDERSQFIYCGQLSMIDQSMAMMGYRWSVIDGDDRWFRIDDR